jgi:hypothetical protein
MARCAICCTLIDTGEPATACPECTQDYHQSCWTEIGGCGTYGCTKAAVANKPAPPVLVGAGWGDTKPCPSCNLEIAASLLVCSCGAKFPWADAMTGPEYRAWQGREASLASSRSKLVWLFIGSLLGVTAPVLGPIAGIYAFTKRRDLAGAGGTYVAMGYGSAAIGVIYTLIIIVLAAGG